MRDPSKLFAALDRLEEALKRRRIRKDRAPLEAELEVAMKRAFKAQGKAFVKRLSKLKGKFEESIGSNDWGPLFDAALAETLQVFIRPISVAIMRALKKGALAVIADASVKLDFSLENKRAAAWIKGRAAERVTLINDTTRDYMRTLVEQSVAEGWSYGRLANAITDRYEEFAVGKPQKHVETRAKLIAITEVGEAYCEGNLQAAQELEAAGIPMEKYWDTVGDERVSAGCKANQAQGWIAIKTEFQSGHQRPLRFPGCRCDILARPKED